MNQDVELHEKWKKMKENGVTDYGHVIGGAFGGGALLLVGIILVVGIVIGAVCF